ncbi:MAG: GAF domain-containing protein, partial [Chloroflexi bacterium]|nr:GAF domain-containing protein [Chloroflexota bacterium]
MILIAHLRQALSSLWAAQSLCLVLFILLAFGLMGISLAAWRAHRRAKRQLEAVRALQRVFTMAPLNLEEMCRLIYDHCLHLVNAPVLILQTRDRAGTLTTPLVVEHDREVEGLSLPDHVWNYLEAGHHSLLIRDWRRGAPLRPLPVGSEPRSGLYVSVVAEERFYGLIALQSPRPRAFTAADGRSLGLLASQLAMGLHTAQLYEQQRERNVQLLTIAEVSRKVAAILDVQTLFADTVQFVQEALGYYHVCILTLDEAGKRVLLQASSSPRIQARGLELPLGYGLIGHAAQSGEPVLANDVTQDERYVIDAGLDKTRAELAIPLKVEDRILGVLDLQSDRVDAFDADDVAVLQVLADQIAVALEDSRIYAMQQEQAWISTALLQVAEALGQQATLDEILATVTRLATLLTGVDRALLLLWSPDGQTFSIGDGAGFPSAELDALRGLAFEGDRVPLLAQMRLGRMTYRGRAEDLWGHLASLVNRPLPLGELLALPLWAGGQFIGALVVEDEGQEIRGAREAILNGVANDAAMALMNARLGAAQREEAWVSTALLQVANVVVRATTNLEETLATVARLTPMLVGIDWCAILLWDEERRAFYCAAAEGQTPNRADMLQGRYLWPEDSPLLADMRNEPGPVVGFCTLESASLRDAMAPYEAQAPVTAFPLRVHERLLGALLAGHDRDCAEIPARRMSILAGIANQTTLAIETAQLYRQSLRQERLRREMELARSIQQSFLPARCPEIPGWDIESEWRAAGEVGGDFYDLVP